ncbi:MAG: hypothetical protein R3F11_16175 [Verrucomicrobiales bacterium]
MASASIWARACTALEAERHAARLDGRAEVFEAIAHRVVRHARGAVDAHATAVLFGEGEDIVDEAAEALAFRDRRRRCGARFRPLALAVARQPLLQQLGIHPDVGERRLEFVRHLVDEADPLGGGAHLPRMLAIEIGGERDQRDGERPDAAEQRQLRPAGR